MMIVTSGLSGIPSSRSAALQSSLENRLIKRLDSAGSTLFVETWKRRATPLRRRYWEHTASAPRTADSACTSVPTPMEYDSQGGGSITAATRKAAGLKRPSGASYGSQLRHTTMLASLPTPQVHDDKLRGNTEADNHYYPHDLSNAVTLASTATPKASDGQGGRTVKTEGGGNSHLDIQARLASLATPRTEDSQCAGAHRGTPDTLHSQANLAAVSTPSSRDWKDTSGMSESGVDPDGSTRTRLDQLPRQAQLADSGPTAIGGTDETASSGQLDPAYSRWLMGVPAAWDVCADLATASLRRKPKSSSAPTSKRGSIVKVEGNRDV